MICCDIIHHHDCMNIKDTLDHLVAQDGRNINQLAIAYGELVDGPNFRQMKRQDTYRNPVQKTLKNPEGATVEVFFRVLKVLGVDAPTAIAIAASQVGAKV